MKILCRITINNKESCGGDNGNVVELYYLVSAFLLAYAWIVINYD
jgi:hypothetical protein